MSRINVYEAIALERAAQDGEYGGPSHDDEHVPNDWLKNINKQMMKASDACGYQPEKEGDPNSGIANDYPDDPDEYRQRMVMIAALAVAAIESHDRIRWARPAEGMPKAYSWRYDTRGGSLEGTFTATDEQMARLRQSSGYFYEVLGKHSEFSVDYTDPDLFKAVDIPVAAIPYASGGHDPFDYIRCDKCGEDGERCVFNGKCPEW